MARTVLPPVAPESSPATGSAPAAAGALSLRLRRAGSVLAPALIYLLIRQAGLLVLGWMSAANDLSVGSELTSWDGSWFLGIAAGGYDGVPAELTDAFGRRSAHTPLAFFPGYPGLIAALSRVPGVGLVTAAFVVTVAAGVVTAYGLARLGELVPGGSRRAGLVLVALFAAAPMSIVLSMTYSEALFCALAAWCLAGLLRGQWLLAGACAAAAGLVRPTAAALVVAVLAAAVVALARGRGGRRPWVGAVLAPSGLIGYFGFVAARTGRWDGWFALQRQGWDSRFDGGGATLRFTAEVLATAPSLLEVVTVWLLGGAVLLLALCALHWWRGPAWPLLVYAALVLAMDLGSNGLMNSKARLLLPAFVLLIPVAIGLARRRTTTVVLTLAGLTAAGAWFGGYALTLWTYAI